MLKKIKKHKHKRVKAAAGLLGFAAISGMLVKSKLLVIIGLAFMQDTLVLWIGDTVGFNLFTIAITLAFALTIWWVFNAKKGKK